jgi:CRP-like cAMP-binding protein
LYADYWAILPNPAIVIYFTNEAYFTFKKTGVDLVDGGIKLLNTMDAQSKRALKLLRDYFDKGRREVFERRQTILGYDAAPENAYLITSGCVKVSSYTSSGNERIHYIYKKDEIFPVTLVFRGKLIDPAFIAFTRVALKSRPIKEFRKFIIEEPLVLRTVVDQQMEVFDRIFNLNIVITEQRVADRLMTLGERFGDKEEGRFVIKFPLTIKELADMVNLSRETTGRVLTKFEERGLVIIGRQNIVIYPDKLSRIIDK